MSVHVSAVELKTLGVLDLREPGGAVVQSVLAQPKRTALFLYLAIARPHGLHQRETLLNLFWGERDEEHARKALRQALYYLRASLGDDIIVSIGDGEVGIARERVWCDAVELERALEEGRWADALELYRGELLPGFFVEDAREFERWLEAERAHVREAVAAAAWSLARQQQQHGDVAAAAVAAARAAALAPEDEAGARLFMQLLAASGQSGGALRVYEELEERLRREYEVAPDAETRAVRDAIRARAGVALHDRKDGRPPEPSHQQPAGSVGGASLSSDPSPTEPAIPSTNLRARHGLVLAVGAVVTLTLSLLAWLLPQRWSGAAVPLDPDLLLVLPFRAGAVDSGTAAVAHAMPLIVAARLQAAPALRVADVAAAGVTSYPRGAVRRAREAGAAQVLTGAIAPTGAGVLLSATLVDAQSERELARASVEGSAAQLDVLIDRLIARTLARASREPEQRLPFLELVPLPALLWYLDGQQHLRAHRAYRALNSFTRALDVDSTFATAALAASIAAGAGGGPWLINGAEQAWRWREWLAPVDRRIVGAKLGPRYPEPSSRAEHLREWEVVARSVVDNNAYEYELMYGYGDYLLHFGMLLGIPDALDRARLTFERAVRIDSSYPGAQQHLADIAFLQRDTARLRALLATMPARRSYADTLMNAWMLATLLRDSAALAALPAERAAAAMYNIALQTAVVSADPEHVSQHWRDAASTLEDMLQELRVQWMLALNRGRTLHAAALADTIVRVASSAPHLSVHVASADRLEMLAALYWQGDPASARRAYARTMARVGEAPFEPSSHPSQVRDLCTLAEWQLAHGDTAAAAALLRGAGDGEAARLCRRVLEIYAAVLRSPDASHAALDSLDALARSGPPQWSTAFPHGNLLIAGLFLRQGRLDRAYAATRRRGLLHLYHSLFLSAHLREEGRFAAALGDTAGAMRAWQHLVTLRFNAEPPLAAERERIAHWIAMALSREGQ